MLDIHLRGRTHTAALIDVEVGGASVAVCDVAPSGIPEIRATAHSKLSLEPQSVEQAVSHIASQISEAAGAALKQYAGNAAIERAYIILHAPWAQSRTVFNRAKYDTDVKIHAPMIAQLAREALAGAGVDRARLIESSVIRVELNGYQTAQPTGKLAHELTVVTLVSECEPSLKSTIESAVAKEFPVARISWRSAMRTLTTFAGRSTSPGNHFCIIDMGPESSHVISVRGAAVEERTTPEGTRTILSRLGSSKEPEEILSAVRMLERDETSPEVAGALQKSLALAEQALVKPFAEAIGSIAATARVSNNLLLLAHPDLEPWLARFFSRIDFAQFTATTLPFSVSVPHDEAVAGGSTLTDSELLADTALFNTEAAASS